MIVLPAYAKLNLALEVTGRAAGGLHTLASVVVRIDWHDLVGLTFGDAHPALPLSVSGDADGVPRDTSNLAVRAAMLAAELGDTTPPAIWLHKRVPAEAGLGGGSADAAVVLAAMRPRLKADAPPLESLAASLGSDIPALLAGGAQLVGGTGDKLESVPTPPLHVVVVHAAPAATGAAYSAPAPSELRGDGRAAALAAQLRCGETPDPSLFGSALEAPALRVSPLLAERVGAIRRGWPSVRWHLTGSGGALFAVVDNAPSGRSLAAALLAAGHTARACRTVAAANAVPAWVEPGLGSTIRPRGPG